MCVLYATEFVLHKKASVVKVKNVVRMCHAITRCGAIVGIVLHVVPCSPQRPRLAGRDMAARSCRATGNQSVREAMREFQATDARECVLAFCTRQRSHGHPVLVPGRA